MFGTIKARVSVSLSSFALLVAFGAVGTLLHAQAAKNILLEWFRPSTGTR